MDEKLASAQAAWESNLQNKVLKRFPERREKFDTESGVEVGRLYSSADLPDFSYEENLGFPGEYPFTRGVQPTMYRGRFWTMRQYAGYADAAETNARFRYLLEQGQTGLSVAFDLPTQIGLDSDHQLARGEVGRVGVAIDSLADMELLFKEIPLDKVSTSMTINAPAAVLLAMYIAVAEKQGADTKKLAGTIQNDILKEYVARGTYIFPPEPSMRLITDTFAYCAENLPEWNPISISGYHIREAGSTAVQEMAFTLADGIAYVQAAIDKGLDVDKFAPRLSFFFNAHKNFFEEIAKYRAVRRMWAKIMRARFGAKNPKSWMLRFHTQTGGSTLTAQQPDVNVVRVAFQALSAVLGGTQSLHTNSKDEALALPTEDSARLALRTQQVIAYETGVADTIDPLAGSYLVEKLTDELEAAAWEYISKIDEMGGAVRAVEAGYMQREIQDSAFRYQQEIENETRIVVGVNKFQMAEEHHEGLLRVDPNIAEKQVARLQRVRATRDNKAVNGALVKLRSEALNGSNVVPCILDAVRAYATLGEICGVLRDVYGEYKPTSTL